MKLYSHYDRSIIADGVKQKIRNVFEKSEEGKLVSSLVASGAMDEGGAESVLEAFVNACQDGK